MKIQNKDIPLVTEFLRREAQDYSYPYPERWAQERLKLIVKGLASYRGKGDYLHINSYGNAGLPDRSLTITPSPWCPNGNIVIDLCTCGSLRCWGTITFPDKKSIGKKGVQPL